MRHNLCSNNRCLLTTVLNCLNSFIPLKLNLDCHVDCLGMKCELIGLLMLIVLSRSVPISKKFLNLVDKISQSRYFQQATEYKYIKKAMEEVSNTRLVLNVEMLSVTGTLAVNIPPPPSDRIW